MHYNFNIFSAFSLSVCNCDSLLESWPYYQLVDLANTCRHLGIDSTLVFVCADL